MAFSARASVAGIALGGIGNALVVVLGLLMPPDDPSRDRVDNALFLLGVIGVLLMLLVPPSGMVSRGPGPRAALVVYGALSVIAVAVADFGGMRQVGWAIKLATAALFVVALRRLAHWA